LRPELVEAQTKKGTGFIKTSAIVGVVAPILALCALIIALGFGVFYNMKYIDHHASSPGYGVQDPSRQ
jgi:hypothetical protein